KGAAYFREQFGGKVVLLGHISDVEDRKVTAKRFITGDQNFARMPRCGTTPNTGFIFPGLYRFDIPGVYIHAAAVNSLLRREILHEIDPLLQVFASFVLALGVGMAGLLFGPMAAGGTLAGASFG